MTKNTRKRIRTFHLCRYPYDANYGWRGKLKVTSVIDLWMRLLDDLTSMGGGEWSLSCPYMMVWLPHGLSRARWPIEDHEKDELEQTVREWWDKIEVTLEDYRRVNNVV